MRNDDCCIGMINKLVTWLRAQLGARGIQVERVWPPALRLRDAIRLALDRSGGPPLHVFVYATHSRTQNTFLKLLPDKSVTLAWRLPSPGAVVLSGAEAQKQSQWIVAPLMEWSGFPQDLPGLHRAGVVFGTCLLSGCVMGAVDLTGIFERASDAGFHLVDVVIDIEPTTANVGCSHVAFVWVRGAMFKELDRFSAERVSRARAFFSAPLLDPACRRPLGWHGAGDYAAGPFNPGVVRTEGRMLAVCRAETDSWPVQARDETRHYSSWRCVLLTLGARGVDAAVPLEFVPLAGMEHARIEDARMFTAGGRLLCNHSVIAPPRGRIPGKRPVRPAGQTCRIGLSELDPSSNQLRFLGFPQLDIALGPVEKNWAMFEHQDGIGLIYSAAPFRVFTAVAGSALEFRRVPVAEDAGATQGRIPWLDACCFLRNSINPIPYDGERLLHVVHQVFPNKHYVFWGVLIDRRTLVPVAATAAPLLRCAGATAPSILYLCSAVEEGDAFLFFAGENDNAACCMRIARATLDASFRPLTAPGSA